MDKEYEVDLVIRVRAKHTTAQNAAEHAQNVLLQETEGLDFFEHGVGVCAISWKASEEVPERIINPNFEL